MSAPKLSVIVTCHNLGRYLDEAVASVLGQTLQDFEILVVDDGSTDADTQRVLASFERPHTRVLRSENLGLPGARNFGLRAALGEYVCFLDADDILMSRWFEKAAALLDHDATLSFVSHWLCAFGDSEWEWTPESCDFPVLLDRNTVNGAALVRRSALEAVGGYDETMRQGCEDWELWVRLTARGFRGTILKEVHFLYRQRADSMTRAMHQGAMHPELFGEIVRRNEAAYREHLEPLLVKRHKESVDVKRALLDLDREWSEVREPERCFWEVEVEARGQKLARIEKLLRAESLLVETRRRIADLETELTRQRAQGAALQAHADALSERADRLEASGSERQQRADQLQVKVQALEAEREALRASLSWRLTGPLRAVHHALTRRRG